MKREHLISLALLFVSLKCVAQTGDTIYLGSIHIQEAPAITIYKDSINVSYLGDNKTFFDLATLNYFIAGNKNKYSGKLISLRQYDINAYNKGKDVEEILKRSNLVYKPFIVTRE